MSAVDFTEFVAGLATSSGQAILPFFRSMHTTEDKSAGGNFDPVTEADRSAEAAGRLENLSELVRAMEEYESLEAFLEHVSLVMDRDNDDTAETVTIMTIHAAKGLEFDHVFLAGWEDGVFPSQRSMDEGGIASLEEERRLAYVAITRARHRASIYHAANRRIYGQWMSSIPSRFIGEIPAEHVDSENSFGGGASLWRAQHRRPGHMAWRGGGF